MSQQLTMCTAANRDMRAIEDAKGRHPSRWPLDRPWPLEPLLRLGGVDLVLLAELVGVDHSTAWRRLQSGLTDTEADHWACAVGLPACFVWHEWGAEVEDEPEQMDLWEVLT